MSSRGSAKQSGRPKLSWRSTGGSDASAGDAFAVSADTTYRLQSTGRGWKATAETGGQAFVLITGVSRNRAYYAVTDYHHWGKLPETGESGPSTSDSSKPPPPERSKNSTAAESDAPSSSRAYAAKPIAESAAELNFENTHSGHPFCTILNALFEQHGRTTGRELSSAEAAAQIMQSGSHITTDEVNRLRSGVGPPPTVGALTGLAKLFGVRRAFLAGYADQAHQSHADPSEECEQHSSHERKQGAGHNPSHKRLNVLFASHSQPSGAPLTSASVAHELQQDGLAVSDASINRLRQGCGLPIDAKTLEALAYYFNVDTEYLTTSAYPAYEFDDAKHATEPHDAAGKSAHSAVFETTQVKVITVAVIDLGRIIGVLSQLAAECISGISGEVQRAERLLLLLEELGAVLSTPRESPAVSRFLLRQIVAELKAARRVTLSHQSLLTRMTALLKET